MPARIARMPDASSHFWCRSSAPGIAASHICAKHRAGRPAARRQAGGL
jgi:hypothetical protein